MNEILKQILFQEPAEKALVGFIEEFTADETEAFVMPRKQNLIEHLTALNDAHIKQAVLNRLVEHFKQAALESRKQEQ